MEHLDNDMDDLFQKAGELYPLKTTGSDWDAVAGKLRDERLRDLNAAPSLTSRGNRNNRRWLFLMLLIPLGFGIAYMSGALNQKSNGPIDLKSAELVNRSKKTSTAGENKTTIPSEKDTGKISEESRSGSAGSGKLSHPNFVGEMNRPLMSAKTKGYAAGDRNITTQNIRNETQQIVATGAAITTRPHYENGNRNFGEISSLNAIQTTNDIGLPGAESSSEQSASVAPAEMGLQKVKGPGNKNADSTVITKVLTTDSSLLKKKSVLNTRHANGVYVGFLVGPDISTVKFQSVKQLGYSAGFLVGYRFNDRLALESGLLYDKKYYYTNGKYFKKDNGYYYPSSNTLNGNCSMLEIPLLLRYDFKTAKNHGFFVKAGLSTYVMTSQFYIQDSSGVRNGEWPVTKTKSYPFSVATLTGGYEFSMNAKTKIQIEPYLKIPLRGLGEGELPISSVGIYFGITRSFR